MKWLKFPEYEPKMGEIIEYNLPHSQVEKYNSLGKFIGNQDSTFGYTANIFTFNTKTYRHLFEFEWRKVSKNEMMAFL